MPDRYREVHHGTFRLRRRHRRMGLHRLQVSPSWLVQRSRALWRRQHVVVIGQESDGLRAAVLPAKTAGRPSRTPSYRRAATVIGSVCGAVMSSRTLRAATGPKRWIVTPCVFPAIVATV